MVRQKRQLSYLNFQIRLPSTDYAPMSSLLFIIVLYNSYPIIEIHLKLTEKKFTLKSVTYFN